MSVRRASSQLLSSRSVHLRIMPRPANLSESREILRVLERFGEISTFKYLRYEYHNPVENVALAIYRDAAAAREALNASPIRFALEKVTRDDPSHQLGEEIAEESDTAPQARNDGVDEILRPSRLIQRTAPEGSQTRDETEKKTPRAPPMPLEPDQGPHQVVSRWFQVTVDTSRVVHQDFVERQPYWKQFTPTKSMGQEVLAKSVPHIGLSDVSKRPMDAHRTPKHVLRIMRDYVEHGMPSLKEMYEEGGREKDAQ